MSIFEWSFYTGLTVIGNIYGDIIDFQCCIICQMKSFHIGQVTGPQLAVLAFGLGPIQLTLNLLLGQYEIT